MQVSLELPATHVATVDVLGLRSLNSMSSKAVADALTCASRLVSEAHASAAASSPGCSSASYTTPGSDNDDVCMRNATELLKPLNCLCLQTFAQPESGIPLGLSSGQ